MEIIKLGSFLGSDGRAAVRKASLYVGKMQERTGRRSIRATYSQNVQEEKSVFLVPPLPFFFCHFLMVSKF